MDLFGLIGNIARTVPDDEVIRQIKSVKSWVSEIGSQDLRLTIREHVQNSKMFGVLFCIENTSRRFFSSINTKGEQTNGE